MLGIVLPNLEIYFGIPPRILYLLAGIPVVFFCFDLYCLLRAREDKRRCLRIIAFLNTGYCCLSLLLARAHRGEITGLGWSYLAAEIAVVLGLVVVEFRVAGQ